MNSIVINGRSMQTTCGVCEAPIDASISDLLDHLRTRGVYEASCGHELRMIDRNHYGDPVYQPCKWCGESFPLNRPDQIFCSRSCSNRNTAEKRRKHDPVVTVEGHCGVCATPISVPLNSDRHRRMRNGLPISCSRRHSAMLARIGFLRRDIGRLSNELVRSSRTS